MSARNLALIEFVIKTGQSSLLNVWQITLGICKFDCFDPRVVLEGVSGNTEI